MSLQMPVFTAPYAPDDGELAADLLAEAPLDREAEGRAHAPRHPRLRLPRDLFAPERINAAGLDFGDRAALEGLLASVQAARSPAGRQRGGERRGPRRFQPDRCRDRRRHRA